MTSSADPAVDVHCGTVERLPDRRTLAFGWFGTSVMEHLEGFNAQMVKQADLPQVGSQVVVESWVKSRGVVFGGRRVILRCWSGAERW